MAEFRISRLRYTWKGGWNTSIAYNKDDVVRYGGNTWVCVRQHTSSAFQTDQEYLANPGDSAATPAWIKMTDGYDYKGIWTQSTVYALNDVVAYGGRLYLCIGLHTSGSTFAENVSNWEVYFVNQKYQDYWRGDFRYGVGDVIRYGGNVYECIIEHTSSPTADGLDADIVNWTLVYSGEEYLSDYQSGVKYELDELVKYGGSILRVTEGHTSGANIDNAKFSTELFGFNFHSDWDSGTYYAEGDVLQHGGYLYRANLNNNNKNPSTSLYPSPVDSTWSLISKATSWRGDWSSNSQYKTGDMVRRGGHLYVALVDTALADDGSTLDYLDSSNWELVVPGQKWNNSWTSGQSYELGDMVAYIGSVYECNFAHTSDNDNFPGDNGSGYDYWTLVLQAGDNVALNTEGDLLSFGLTRSNVGDGSTIGPNAIPIGADDELVMVSSQGTISYNKWGEILKFRYVGPDGVDDDTDVTRGISPFKPYKTVRFACEQIEALGTNSDLHKIFVEAGVYEEILPIIVPAGTAVQGSELRSTTLLPNPADPLLTNDRTYHIDVLERISDLMGNILSLQAVLPSTGNTVTQATNVSGLENVSFDPPQFPLNPDGSVGDEVFQEPEDYASAPTITIRNLIVDAIAYVNFHLNSSGSEPTLTGTNTLNNTAIIRNIEKILRANRQFLIEEAVAFVTSTYPAYTFSATTLRNRIRSYIDGFIHDVKYTGNYKTIWAARHYRNEVNGSQLEDMFYVRNSTGVRDMSLKNLSGSLNPPNVAELYRRPTGGSYVSLDPGWGPADNRTWITTRSPYIQNVTTFGTNCVGQKIDGALHSGGNKSIVSNDFTQVLSDGIGAWALNNGRAELVSVFTYYCQIGMFSEDGGVIRATNGNSSYGDFGAISDGNDPTETPTYAEVDTRNGQALVDSAFAGEVNDEILVLEYAHAGEKYSLANYTFVGSGTGASVVQEEFRDTAIFQALVKNAPDEPGATEGGLRYINAGNNAQAGNTTSLTLASNDTNTEAEILGTRLIITSGKGAGQYGYVTGYNAISKICTVSRESNDQPGWDHVIPGTPSQPLLFTDNTYRFEPRPIFSDPGFTSSIVNVADSANWTNVVYGETREVFTSVSGTAGTGETDGITPVTATFNVVKNSRKYEVTIQGEGAGYELNQEIIIKGSTVGGLDDEHDIIITVTGITDDSTNSITAITSTGIANSGKFVITANGTPTTSYSGDGTNWTLGGNMPSTGNWKALAAGDSGTNRFVSLKYGSDSAARSRNGTTWTASLLPITGNWESVVYGKSDDQFRIGVYLAVASDGDKAVYSTDGGINWYQTTIPDIGDSSFNQWVDVAYGKGKFVAVANSGNFVAVGEYNSVTDAWTWDTHIMDVIDDSSVKDWRTITYGNNRFVAISGTGEVAYSFNGTDWLPGTMPSQDGSTAHNWKQVRYGQGVFFAIGDTGSRDIAADATTGPTRFAATSYDGVLWTERTLAQDANWSAVAFGNPDISLGDSTTQSNSTPLWVAVASNLDHGSLIKTGARALGRCIVESGSIKTIRLWEPGSGYELGATVNINDPNNTADAYVEIRIGDAVLAQPEWLNRGSGYRTSSTQVTILGDGFADIIPSNQFVDVSNLQVLPGPGTQFRFRGDTANYYTVQTIESITEKLDGTYDGRFRITPQLSLNDYLEHSSLVEVRQRYSQVRITGHDFLDVGTGNFVETNYPTIYTSAQDYVYAPENEVVEANGGRVFYTSTDQSGNFRCGELFAVEQATGIVTISADFFDLQGLTELALGGVRLGGSGTVVREFSTDPLFTQDSNNVVPTQRAIKAYLQNRLNVGGSDLLTASFIAGTVKVGPNQFSNVAGIEIVFPDKVDFSGNQAQISGSMLAQTMFHRSFGD